jgi:putative transposase
MVRFRRNFVAGGAFFFTVMLADRTSKALTDHVGALRWAFRDTRLSRPFTVDAVVVLPEHLHIVMTLPEADADYSSRLSLIKRRFTDAVMKSGVPVARHRNGEIALWQRRYWEHTIRDERDFVRHVDYIHFNPIKHGLVAVCAIGRIPRFTALCKAGCCRGIGEETSARISEVLASGVGDPEFRCAQSGLRALGRG